MAKEKTNVLTAELRDDAEQIAKYDPEMRFRHLEGITARLIFAMTVILSIFHIYTAGFGVLQEWRHRAFHLAFVLPLVFFVYAMKKEVHKEKKHLLYDIFYAASASILNTSIFREIFSLSFGGCAVLAPELTVQDLREPAAASEATLQLRHRTASNSWGW